MEDVQEFQELEEMRSQMELLRKKLEHEDIINEKLMRETMRFRLTSINKQVWIDICMALFCVIVYPLFFPFLPLWLLIYVVVMVSADAIATVLIHRPVREKLIMNDDLKTVAQKMRRLKKAYIVAMCVESPVVIVFIVLFLMTVAPHFHNPRFAIWGGVIGGCIGLIVGLMMVRRVLKNSDAIIKQIEE